MDETPKLIKINLEYEGTGIDEKQKQDSIDKLEEKVKNLKTLPKNEVVDKKINQIETEILKIKKSD